MASHFASSLIVLLATVVAVTQAIVGSIAVFGDGDCPVTTTKAGFNRNQYLGRWYEFERFPNWFEIAVVCGTATYGNKSDGSISVVNAGKREVSVFGHVVYTDPTYIQGNATVPNPAKPAELRVSFSEYDRGSTDANYFVVDTDYTSYAVVFSCTKLPIVPYNTQILWILTRQPGVAPTTLATIKSNLQSFGIDTSKLNPVRQTDC